jgi:hypothetical protein
MVLVSFEDTGALRVDGYVCVTEKISYDSYNIEYRRMDGVVTRYSDIQEGTLDIVLGVPTAWKCSR